MFKSFVEAFDACAERINKIAVDKGWWEKERNDGEILCLVHAEVSEGLEGLRAGNPPSEHIPEFSAIEEELADVVIRCMDYAKARGWRLAQAIEAKIAFNEQRAYKHGGKKF